MILLPHGCSCSEISVNPKNWKTGNKSLLKKNWRIHYYFRDPEFKNKHPYGKLISIKGMNRFKTLEERRAVTQLLIDEEIYILKTQGYNPITKTNNGPEIELNPEILPETTICDAIDLAKNKIECVNSTLNDLKVCARYFNKSCRQLKYHNLKIGDVKRIHVKNILDNQRLQNNYSNNRFNKVRANMLMIFKQLVLCDAIDYNVVSDIEKKKETKKIRVTFTNEEVNEIKKHLKSNYYTFYRYMQIFFHSGCRSTELFDLKIKDIDFNNQRFKVLVKKGRSSYEEQWRAINKNSLEFWKELINESKLDDYVFSYKFCPGNTKISARQVSIKWRKYIKIDLGINKDFYLLKHLHTTKVIDLYASPKLASGINGHKSTRMNEKHYDLHHDKRIIEDAKKIDVSL